MVKTNKTKQVAKTALLVGMVASQVVMGSPLVTKAAEVKSTSEQKVAQAANEIEPRTSNIIRNVAGSEELVEFGKYTTNLKATIRHTKSYEIVLRYYNADGTMLEEVVSPEAITEGEARTSYTTVDLDFNREFGEFVEKATINLRSISTGKDYRTETVVFDKIANNAPQILGASDKEINQGDVFGQKEILAGVTAIDKEDGDITDQITTRGQVDTEKPGVYPITYSVIDSQGLASTLTINITVKAVPNTAPVITGAKDQTITEGATFGEKEILAGVKATDKEDGDITKNITYTGTVDTAKPGVYPITYNVKDSKGLSATVTINITVKAAPNTAPVITGAKDQTIKEGATFGEKEILAGVKATDKEDGDITKNITYTGTVDTAKPGVYPITYNVNDSKGLAAKPVTVKITVEAAPVMDYSLSATDYTIGDQALTGKYGKDVFQVRLFVNGTLISQATKANGSFTFNDVNKTILKPTDKVEVVAVNSGYKEVNRVSVKLKGEAIKDYALTANDYKIGTPTLVGTYGADVFQVRLFVNGTSVAQASKTNGKFTFANATKFIKNPTDKVEVVAIDAQYKEVNRKAVKTSGESLIDFSLTANDYKIGTATLTGTYGKSVSKVRLVVNGEKVSQASKIDGKYTFTDVTKFIKDPTDKVEVVAVDGQYKEQNRITVKLSGDSLIDYSLTANDYKLGTETLTGTYGKNVAKVRLEVDGKTVSQADKVDGKYTFTDVTKFIKNPTDKVAVVAVDGQFKEQNRVTVKLSGQSIIDTTLTAGEYKLGQANLTGTYGKSIDKVRLVVNGDTVKQANLTNGKYTFASIASFIKNPTDKVEVVGVDAQFKELNRISVKITGEINYDYAITAAKYTVGDNELAGKYGKDIKAVRLEVNGTNVKQAVLNEDGTYTLKGIKGLIKKGDKVAVIAINEQYNEVNRVTVVVDEEEVVHDYALTAPKEYVIGTATISGTHGKDIKGVRLFVNGEVKKNATLAEGKYELKGISGIKEGDDVRIVGIDGAFKEVNSLSVKVLAAK
ncbi:DUF5011 domain-containing protein [Brochothrix thermosphacta]|uniref:DUF5011 domain-containing protein n=1 Tax=Brochothrix thermosphacta TaxID=2756 RepID=UPI000EBD58B4|nr:DUF5011 domain-containing protein [Brochothrix thermosphacta]HCZ39667.1 hypothetical protein [Brochothrix thermosphacta]HCZ45147.1 hypothetical protein [Brochothrix thermosphacta]